MSSSSLYLCLLASLISVANSGQVGECRTECIERNSQLIVRVHLRDDWVMAGLCNNATSEQLANAILYGSEKPFRATVTPYMCDRKVGIWTLDELDEEGIVKFNVFCPKVARVPQYLIDSCPK